MKNGNGTTGHNNGNGERAPGLPRMPWYPRDFRSSTLGWPDVARGAYRELLDAQWDMGALPADSEELRKIAAYKPANWRIAWPIIEPKFPIGEDGLRRNLRCAEHYAEALQLHQKRRQGAAATNAKRWAAP